MNEPQFKPAIYFFMGQNLKSFCAYCFRFVIVDTQNWHDEGFLDNLGSTGQTGLDKFVKLQIGLHHCVYLVETIEMHI